MEEREKQVWQRVSCGPQSRSEDIRPLLLSAAESVAVYRQLTGMLTGSKRERGKDLLWMARQSLDTLKGIQLLSGYPAGRLHLPPVPKEPARRLLEKSFRRCLGQMTEYTARSLDPEYGIVWQGLADREKEVAMLLTELIGTTEE